MLLGAVALALVVLLVGALLLLRGNGSSPSPTADPSTAPSAPSASASAPTTAGSGSAAPSAGSSSGTLVPAGWQVQNGSRGWSIAVPPGFTRSEGRSANQTDFRNADGILLRVEIAPQANASAIGDWRSYEPTFARQVSNYQRVRIDPADGGDGTQKADWEFTFSGGSSQLHVLNQGKIDGRSAHALYWQTPESVWNGSQQLREQIFATFQPPPQ
ncbi:MAG: eukaryotic-like serine/threonine-protein kinase [Frankiaceae bacterium]|nr:eukaryotic-like serine/threonine-protein kinase [Frankiaceae bacterium]